MRLASFGLIAIAEHRPLSRWVPSLIGLGPRGAQTVPVIVIIGGPGRGDCRRGRSPAAARHTSPQGPLPPHGPPGVALLNPAITARRARAPPVRERRWPGGEPNPTIAASRRSPAGTPRESA